MRFSASPQTKCTQTPLPALRPAGPETYCPSFRLPIASDFITNFADFIAFTNDFSAVAQHERPNDARTRIGARRRSRGCVHAGVPMSGRASRLVSRKRPRRCAIYGLIQARDTRRICPEHETYLRRDKIHAAERVAKSQVWRDDGP